MQHKKKGRREVTFIKNKKRNRYLLFLGFLLLAVLFFWGKDFYRTYQVKRLVKSWELEKAKAVHILVRTIGEKEVFGDEVTTVKTLEDKETIHMLARQMEELEWKHFVTGFRGRGLCTCYTCLFNLDGKEGG